VSNPIRSTPPPTDKNDTAPETTEQAGKVEQRMQPSPRHHATEAYGPSTKEASDQTDA
jgi:hypothetical protein